MALTKTPSNSTHGQRSKNLTIATDILESSSNFVDISKVYLFDYGNSNFSHGHGRGGGGGGNGEMAN